MQGAMHSKIRRGSYMAGLSLLSLVTPALGQRPEPQQVQIRFIKSSAADYVMYLLFRSTGSYNDLENAVPLPDIPVMEERISLPEVAASSDITSYSQLFPLIEPYRHPNGRVVLMPDSAHRYRIIAYSNELPTYQRLRTSLEMGAAEYPAFVRYWTDHIAPDESARIAVWQDQADRWHPFDGLQSLARLRFPAQRVDIGALALHGSGSGNTDPEGIYTTLAVKNVAWMIGHEGTHLLVDEFGGSNWKGRPGAQETIALAVKRGATGADIEEALCLLMQVKLSQLYGQTPADFKISPRVTDSVKKEVLTDLENRWPEYQANPRQNLMDWFISVSRTALSRPALGQHQ